MKYIDAVVLWVVRRWNRCSYPSQALRASSPGGRAKGSEGIDGRSIQIRFTDPVEVCTWIKQKDKVVTLSCAET